MRNPICCPLQSDASEEEDYQHYVGEYCGDINDFAGLGDALNHAEINESPCDDQR